MIKIVGVTFDGKQIFYCQTNDFNLKKGINVIVKTDRGKEFGQVEIPTFEVEEGKTKKAIYDIISIASKNDFLKHQQNVLEEKKAIEKCKEFVNEKKLLMNIVDANFTFDRSQLLFRFTADGRIDFRGLAKELANFYKTRIELRQIGIRDKAKEIGGCGICGRMLCCSRFNNGDFVSVSINMAKNQDLSLNPSKINGVCGRLLCCLRYENENYSCSKKKLPKMGTIIETDKGKGKVVSVKVLEEKYSVDIPEEGIIEYSANGSD